MKILNSNKNFEIIVDKSNHAEVKFKGIPIKNILNFKLEIDTNFILPKFVLTKDDVIKVR